MSSRTQTGRHLRPETNRSKLKTFLDKAGFLGLALALLGGLAVTVPQAFAEAPGMEWAAVAEADGYTDTDHGAADYTADDYDADADSGYSYAGYGYIPAPDDNPGYGDDYSSDYGYAGTDYDADGGYDYDANAPPADNNDNDYDLDADDADVDYDDDADDVDEDAATDEDIIGDGDLVYSDDDGADYADDVDVDEDLVEDSADGRALVNPGVWWTVDLEARWAPDGPGNNLGPVGQVGFPDGWNQNRAVAAGTHVTGYVRVNLNDVEFGTAGSQHVDLVFRTVNGGISAVPGLCGGGSANSFISADGDLYCRLVNFSAATAVEIPFVVVVSGGDAYQVATVQVETRSGRYEHIIALQPIHVAPAPAQIDVALSPGVVNQGSMANMFRVNAPFSVAVPERAAVTAGEVSFYYLLTDLPDAPIAWWELVQLDPALRADSGEFTQVGAGGANNIAGVPNQGQPFQMRVDSLADRQGFRVTVRGFNHHASLDPRDATGNPVRGDMRFLLSSALRFDRLDGTLGHTDMWTVLATVANVSAQTVDGRAITVDYLGDNNDQVIVVPAGGGGGSNSWARLHLGRFAGTGQQGQHQRTAAGWDFEPHWNNPGFLSQQRIQGTAHQGSVWDTTPQVASGRSMIAIGGNDGAGTQTMCFAHSAAAPFTGEILISADINENGWIRPEWAHVYVTTAPRNLADLECFTGDWTRVTMRGLAHNSTADGRFYQLASDLRGGGGMFYGTNIDPRTVTAIRVHGIDPRQGETPNLNLNVDRIHEVAAHTNNVPLWTVRSVNANPPAYQTATNWTQFVGDPATSAPVTGPPGRPIAAGVDPVFAHVSTSRDVAWGLTWAPEVFISATPTAAGANQQVTFTTRATPLRGAIVSGPATEPFEQHIIVHPDLVLDRDSIEIRVGSQDATPTTGIAYTFADTAGGVEIRLAYPNAVVNVPIFVTFTARAQWDSGVRPVQTLIPTPASLLGEWVPEFNNHGRAGVNISRTVGGTVSLAKDIDNAEAALDAPNAWAITFTNGTHTGTYVDVVDILPFIGDGRGTSFSGDFTIDDVTVTRGAAVYWTTAAPETIDPNPRSTTNANPGAAGSIWSATKPADATAITGIRFVGAEATPPGGQDVFRIYWTPQGSEPGDRFVNYAWANESLIDMRLIRAEQSSTVEEPTALQVHVGIGTLADGYVYWPVVGRNSGTNIATSVTIDLAFSSGVERVNASGNAVGSTLFVGRMNPGQLFETTIRTRITDMALLEYFDDSGIPAARLTAIIANFTNPADAIVYQENASVEADIDQWDRDTVLVPTPQISVTKTIDGQNLVGVPAGRPLTVTFEMANDGDEPLTNLTLVDETIVGIAVENISFPGLVFTSAGYLADSESGELVILAPGGTLTATGVLPGMVAGERHENIVRVTGVGIISGGNTSDDDRLTVETVGVEITKDILVPVNGERVNGVVYLDVNPETGLTTAQTITFTITNQSSEGLTNLVLEDTILYGQPISDISFAAAIVESVSTDGDVVRVVFRPDFVLDVGESITGTGVLAPMAAGERHHNAASVRGNGVDTDTPTTDDTDDPADPDNPGELVVETAAIRVVKHIDGQQLVGTAPGTPLTVMFEVTNIGSAPLSRLTLTDVTLVGPAVEDITFPGFVFNPSGYLANATTGALVVLASGETITATGVLPGMAAGERHENLVTVTGRPPGGERPVTDDDRLVVETVAVHISKDILVPVNGQIVNGIAYLNIDPETGMTSEQVMTFTITNQSSEGLRNLVLEDTLIYGQPISDISFDAAIVESVSTDGDTIRIVFRPDFVLGVGESITGTGILAPLAAGERHHNAASVRGTGVDTDTPTEDGTDTPADPDNPADNEKPVFTVAISVTKTIDGYNFLGVELDTEQVVEFAVTNIGSAALTRLTLTDVTLVGPEVEDITFPAMVFNQDGYLADATTGALVVLAPGETITATGVLPGMAAGERHENIVTVTGLPPGGGQTVQDDDQLIVETVGIHISKDILVPTNGVTIDGVVFLDIDPATGLTSEQLMTFTITNRSSEPLVNLEFADRLVYGQPIRDLQFDPAIVQSVTSDGDVVRIVFRPEFVLGVGEQITGTGILPPMATGERHHNVAFVQGTGQDTGLDTSDGSDQPGYPGGDGPDGQTPPPRVPDNELIADTIGIRLEKFIAGAPVNSDGHPILEADRTTGIIPSQTITFRITNIGSEALTGLEFTDVTLELPSLSSVAFPTVPGAVVIPVGDDWRVEFGSFVLNPGDVLYGTGVLPPLHGSDLKHHNVATVVGTGIESGREVTDTDNLLIDPADLEITKTVTSNDGEYRAGGAVTWTVTLTNHGPDRAQNVDIIDRLETPNLATITGARFSQVPAGRATRLSYTASGVDAWLEYVNAGETVIILIDGILAQDVSVGAVVINTVRVESDTPNYGTYSGSSTSRMVVRQGPPAGPQLAITGPRLTQTGANLILGIIAIGVIGSGVALIATRRRHTANN